MSESSRIARSPHPYDPVDTVGEPSGIVEAAPCLADVIAMVPLLSVLTLALDARITVRPTGPAGQPRKAYICAEVTEAGRFGERTRVVGAVTIREQELTADGRSAASCRSDPQPTSMSAYMSALHVDVEYRKFLSVHIVDFLPPLAMFST